MSLTQLQSLLHQLFDCTTRTSVLYQPTAICDPLISWLNKDQCSLPKQNLWSTYQLTVQQGPMFFANYNLWSIHQLTEQLGSGEYSLPCMQLQSLVHLSVDFTCTTGTGQCSLLNNNSWSTYQLTVQEGLGKCSLPSYNPCSTYQLIVQQGPVFLT